MKWILVLFVMTPDGLKIPDDIPIVFEEQHQCQAVGAAMQSTSRAVLEFHCALVDL